MRVLAVLVLGGCVFGTVAAQSPVPTRGPVHEAFATTAERSLAGVVVPKLPPDAVNELPAGQKPATKGIQWIGGYWHFDEERQDFAWISGCWRAPPPGHIWLPGRWREVTGGWQWVPGFWHAAQPVIELTCLPVPPMAIDQVSAAPAPGSSHTFQPGHWEWSHGHYSWKPGFWAEHRPDWIWMPAHSQWTPAGHVFIAGYWDHALNARGTLFAPVTVPAAIVATREAVTPRHALSPEILIASLYTRSGTGQYYFGDYSATRYQLAGFSPWCGMGRSTNFAGKSARPVPFDPLWEHFRMQHRDNPGAIAKLQAGYAGTANGFASYSPRTSNMASVSISLKGSTVEELTNVKKVTSAFADLTKQRGYQETAIAERFGAPVAQNDKTRSVKLIVPAILLPETKDESVPPPANEQTTTNELRTKPAVIIPEVKAPPVVVPAVIPPAVDAIPVKPMPKPVLPLETEEAPKPRPAKTKRK